MQKTETNTQFIGIDVSKATFDVAIPQANGKPLHKQFANTLKGFKSFLKTLPSDSQCVMEATGNYHLKLAVFLHSESIAVSVLNPLIIKQYAKMRLSKAKTDKKDAFIIQEYAQTMHPPRWNPSPDTIQTLKQQTTTLKGLQKMHLQARQQLQAIQLQPEPDPITTQILTQTIQHLQKQLKNLQQQIQQLVIQHYPKPYKALQSIPGIGNQIATTLITITDGFTKFLNHKQLIAYIGLSPRITQSGTSVKTKAHITKMGTAPIRTLLYMGSCAAIKHNPICKEFYLKLLNKGKPKKVALIAVANKLVKQAFAIATQNTTFIPNYQHSIPT